MNHPLDMPDSTIDWDPTRPMPLDALRGRRDASARLLLAAATASARGDGEPAPPWRPASVVRLVCVGLTADERRLLDGTLRLSQRRAPRLECLSADDVARADVVIVDARHAGAVAWARERPTLADRPVIWVDRRLAPPGHHVLPRPVHWPVLPMIVSRVVGAARHA